MLTFPQCNSEHFGLKLHYFSDNATKSDYI